MLLYCQFPESPVCRALTPSILPVFLSPTSLHGFRLTSPFQKIISTSLILMENKLGDVYRTKKQRSTRYKGFNFSFKGKDAQEKILAESLFLLQMKLSFPRIFKMLPHQPQGLLNNSILWSVHPNTRRPGCCRDTTPLASDSRYDLLSLSAMRIL